MTATYIPPYISAGEFAKSIKFLSRRRPDPLTVKMLQEIGISESNSYTLKGSLVRMGIYDEEGKLLQCEDLIDLGANENDVQRRAFKKILERTYNALLEAIPVEEATVPKVRHYFERHGAASAPALKGARLFIWLASQAGFQTADVDFVPYSLEKDKSSTEKTRQGKKDVNKTRRLGETSKLVPKIFNKTFVENDYEKRLLNILLDKINSANGLPSAEILQQVRELIESQEAKKKARQSSEAPEPDSVKESPDA
jgi:hypothetical protein